MKHLPNLLTIFRIILIPIFVRVYLFTDNGKTAAWIFLTAGITDVLDGYIARNYNLQTQFGALLDPLADKLLHLSVTACLAFSGFPYMKLLFVILLIKELILIIGAAKLYKKNNIVVAAHWYGKAASVIIFVLIWFSIYMGDILEYHIKASISFIATLTAISAGVGYIINYFKNVKRKIQS